MKDAYYFSHDSNARNDLKMLKLRRLHGIEGYGLFFCVIEMLRETNGYKLNLSVIPEICFDLRVDENVFEGLFESGLLQKNGEYFYSDSLLKRMEIREEIREKRSASGKLGAIAKHTQSDSKASDKQMPSKCQASDQQGKERKGKEIKGKEIKGNESSLPAILPEVKTDFIEILLNDFCDVYKKNRNSEFDLTAKAKERSAIGKLLKLYKQKNPNDNLETTRIKFIGIYDKCITIKDNWIYENMSPSIILSKWNTIKTILNGKKSEQFDSGWLEQAIERSKSDN